MVGWRAAAQTPGVPAVCCLSECCVPSWDRGCCTDPPGREEGGPWLPACVCHNGVTASAALTCRVRLPERFKGETRLPEHKPWMCFLLFFPSPVDKEGRSLLVKAMLPAATQSSRATFRWQADILYLSAFKRNCWPGCMLTEAKHFVFMLHLSKDVYRNQTQMPLVPDLFAEFKNVL